MRPLLNTKSIALVTSSLVSLLEDQVRFLKSVRITVKFIWDEQTSEETSQLIERGVSVNETMAVHASPKRAYV